MQEATPSLAQPKKNNDTLLPALGFLGVGWIGKNRMEAIAHNKAGYVTAVSDAYPDNLRAALEACPTGAEAASFEAMLEMPLDGVVIATPSALHAEQSIQALEKGMAVFCQKPLGRTAAEAKKVVDAAKANNCLLGVDFSYRHTCFRKIYDIIQNGSLGDIYAVELVFHNAWGPDKEWFYNPALSGGGCVMDLGVHLVDLALWSLNQPQVTDVHSNLYAGGRLLEDPSQQVEDYATALMRLDQGKGPLTSMQLICSWNLPAGKEAEIGANFYGTKGGVAFRNMNGSFYDFQALLFNGTHTEVLFEGKDDWGGRAAVAWARKLATGNAFDPEAEQIVQVSRVLDNIYGR